MLIDVPAYERWDSDKLAAEYPTASDKLERARVIVNHQREDWETYFPAIYREIGVLRHMRERLIELADLQFLLSLVSADAASQVRALRNSVNWP